MAHVSPVCLPDPLPSTPPKTKAVVAGWGATDPDSVSRPKVLQAVEVETIDNSVCMNWHLRTGIRWARESGGYGYQVGMGMRWVRVSGGYKYQVGTGIRWVRVSGG